MFRVYTTECAHKKYKFCFAFSIQVCIFICPMDRVMFYFHNRNTILTLRKLDKTFALNLDLI